MSTGTHVSVVLILFTGNVANVYSSISNLQTSITVFQSQVKLSSVRRYERRGLINVLTNTVSVYLVTRWASLVCYLAITRAASPAAYRPVIILRQLFKYRLCMDVKNVYYSILIVKS